MALRGWAEAVRELSPEQRERLRAARLHKVRPARNVRRLRVRLRAVQPVHMIPYDTIWSAAPTRIPRPQWKHPAGIGHPRRDPEHLFDELVMRCHAAAVLGYS